VGSEVQVLSTRKNIYLFSLKKWARKNPETVVVSGFFGAISILVAQYGQAVNNAFEQAQLKYVAKSMFSGRKRTGFS